MAAAGPARTTQGQPISMVLICVPSLCLPHQQLCACLLACSRARLLFKPDTSIRLSRVGTKSAELDILPYVGEKGEHHLLSVGGAGATMKQYEWQVTLGVPHDCSEEKYSYPVQSDWVWLNRSTTREAPVQVKCPYEPTAQCREFQGPWPEQYTELVKLWVKTDSDGQSTPSSLWMHAAGVPFSITKVYKSITAGNPDPSKFVAPKHCDGD